MVFLSSGLSRRSLCWVVNIAPYKQILRGLAVFMFLIQSAILLAVAFILGCILGCWLRRLFVSDTASSIAVGSAITAAIPVPSAPELVAKAVIATAPEPVTLVEPIAAKVKTAGKKARPKAKSTAKKEAAIATLDASTVKVSPKSAAKQVIAPVKKSMAIKLAKPIGGRPDNLTLIKGIGNVLEKRLFDLGVFHFEQIANWTKEQAVEFSKAVGFPGRVERENWVKEAAIFAKGATTDHTRKVEAGNIPTSRKSSAAEKSKKK